jgi:nitroreductase
MRVEIPTPDWFSLEAKPAWLCSGREAALVVHNMFLVAIAQINGRFGCCTIPGRWAIISSVSPYGTHLVRCRA